MKLFLRIFAVLIVFAGPAAAADPDIARHPICRLCDMDRFKFRHSRVVLEYPGGETDGLCSLHCAAIALALSIDRAPERISVGDYDTGQLVDADTAAWVLEGDMPGVMTTRAKWAFTTEAAAKEFVAKNGGRIATFEQALQAAYEDFLDDIKMIREKRARARGDKPAIGNTPAKP